MFPDTDQRFEFFNQPPKDYATITSSFHGYNFFRFDIGDCVQYFANIAVEKKDGMSRYL